MGPAPIKLALVGAGRWGKRFISTINQMPGVELAALITSRPENSALVPETCRVVADWRVILSASDIDGVIVATPPATHFHIASAAIQAGKPVLIEKPVTMDVQQAEDLLKLARQKELPVLVDHIHLFSTAFNELKATLGEIGTITGIKSSGGNYGPVRPDTPMLWDWAPHDLSMCLDIMNCEPKSVHAELLASEPFDGGIGRHISIQVVFPDGVSGHIEISNIARQKTRRFEVIGDQGSLIYDDLAPNKLCMIDRSGKILPIPLSDGSPLKNLIGSFSKMIIDGNQQTKTLEQGVLIVRLLTELTAV